MPSITGEIVGGGEGGAGSRRVILTKTSGVGSPYQILNRDSNKIINNNGATAEVYLNLPINPQIGFIIGGDCVDADKMRFVAQGSQQIRLGTLLSAAAGNIQLALGASIDLIYESANLWLVRNASNGILVVDAL